MNDFFANNQHLHTLSHKTREGELAVDVFHTDTELFICSAIAGVSAEDLEISLSGDIVTIRGTRTMGERPENAETVIQECYSGVFSRSVLLPFDVDPESIYATLKQGILTITLRKQPRRNTVRVEEIPS